MKVLVLLLVVCLVGYGWGLSCASCKGVVCRPPYGDDCEKVRKPCGCCDVCALELGEPCGSFTQPCRSGLWCAKEEKNQLIAYREIPVFLPFNGVCAKITTCKK